MGAAGGDAGVSGRVRGAVARAGAAGRREPRAGIQWPGHGRRGHRRDIRPRTGSGPQGQLTPYFQLAVAPGAAVTATVVVANLARQAQTLALSHAIGVTAGNGGSAYVPAARRCSGPACWVTGLPSRITLPAGYRELVTFTVRVPRRTPPGQYLTGIAAAPASRPTSVKLGTSGPASAGAVILHMVTVGVAITVGDLSSLSSRLSIRGVQGTTEGPVARLNISLYNTGQAFAKGSGQASCRAAGRPSSYPVYAGTVLPGDHALIAVNAPGLPEGASVPCTVAVRYGKSQVVSWSGLVAIPGSPRERVVQTGKGAYTVISPQNGIPGWGITLIVIGLLLLAAVSVLLYRQRRLRS